MPLEDLHRTVVEGFSRVDERFARIEDRLAQNDARWAQSDARLRARKVKRPAGTSTRWRSTCGSRSELLRKVTRTSSP